MSQAGQARDSNLARHSATHAPHHEWKLRQIVAIQAEIAAAGHDSQAVMELIAERAMHITNAAGAAITLPEGDELVYVVACGLALPIVGTRLKIDSSLAGYCYLTGITQHARDTEKDSRIDILSARQFGLRSMIFVPLHSGGAVNCVLTVLSQHVAAFGEADLNALQLMAGLMGGALSRAAEYEATSALAAIIESSNDAIVSRSLAGTILSWNPAAERLYGWQAEEVVGRHIAVLWPEEKLGESPERLTRLLRGERLDHYETTRMTKDGRRLQVSHTVSPIRNARGEIIALSGITRDITELKRAQEAARARQAAEAANQAKNKFLARMSHELRTPLNVILGFGQLLEMEELPLEQHESVSYILQAGQHLLRLVNEVLDISRIEEGRIGLEIEPLQIGVALTESIELIRPLAAQRSIELQSLTLVRGGPAVLADPQRLRQVLLNLLSNAVKYNRQGGSVTVSCERVPGERIRVAIADTGEGIPAERMDKLFTPFERLGAEQNEVEGAGLGLVLSKLLVEAMDGTIGARSQPGAGSVFWIELPAAAG